MDQGRIQQVSICGDFFGSELSELEESLRGRRLDPEDLADFADADLSRYIAGLQGQDLIDLLCY